MSKTQRMNVAFQAIIPHEQMRFPYTCTEDRLFRDNVIVNTQHNISEENIFFPSKHWTLKGVQLVSREVENLLKNTCSTSEKSKLLFRYLNSCLCDLALGFIVFISPPVLKFLITSKDKEK